MKSLSLHLPAALLCLAVAAASMATASILILMGKYASVLVADPVNIFSWMLITGVAGFALAFRFCHERKLKSHWQLPCSAFVTTFTLFAVPVMYIYEASGLVSWTIVLSTTAMLCGFVGAWLGQESTRLADPYSTLLFTCATMGAAIGTVALGAGWLGTESAFTLSANLSVVLAGVHLILSINQTLSTRTPEWTRMIGIVIAVVFTVGITHVATRSEEIQNTLEQKRLGALAQ